MLKGVKMNLPNRITLTRIFLIPLIIFFYLFTPLNYGKLIASGLFLVAVVTDFFDGYLARKNNQITVLGTFLDTIADKMLVISALILLVCDGTIILPYGAIFAIIIVIREFLVSALRQLCASKNVVLAADMWGKVKANFQFFAILFFMVLSYLKQLEIYESLQVIFYFEIVCYVLMALTVIMTIISALHYLIKNREVFKS